MDKRLSNFWLLTGFNKGELLSLIAIVPFAVFLLTDNSILRLVMSFAVLLVAIVSMTVYLRSKSFKDAMTSVKIINTSATVIVWIVLLLLMFSNISTESFSIRRWQCELRLQENLVDCDGHGPGG